MPGGSAAWRRQLAPQAAQLVSSQREFELDAKPECARVGLRGETAQIGRVVLDPADRIEPEFAKADASGKHRPDPVLRFLAVRAQGDDAVILKSGLEMRIEAEPRLGGHQEARRPDAPRPHFLRKQGVDGVERIQTEQRYLLLHQRSEGEGARIRLPRRVLIFDEQPDIRPILALRRQLKKSFEGRRIIAKAVTGISGKLRLDTQLQPVGEPVFELVNGGLAVAEHKIVLELELMRLDYRAADLEVLGFGLKRRGGNDDARG